jgi:hypothetical protein
MDSAEVLQKRDEFDESDTPEESPGDLPAAPEKNHATEQNRTLHNPAAASLAAVAAVDSGFAGVDLVVVREKAIELRSVAKSLDRDWVWRLVAIGELIDPDLIPAAVKRIKAREVAKPQGDLEKVFRDECTKRGREFRDLLRLAPEPPPPATSTVESTGPPVDRPAASFKRPPRAEKGIRDLGTVAAGS